jgi:hypothetical protein
MFGKGRREDLDDDAGEILAAEIRRQVLLEIDDRSRTRSLI